MKLHPDQMGHHHAAPKPRSRYSQALPRRYRPVLLLAAQGFTNGEIGLRLCLSEKTVKNYMVQLLDFFHATHRLDMVLEAMKQGYAPCPHHYLAGHPPQRKPRPRRKP